MGNRSSSSTRRWAVGADLGVVIGTIKGWSGRGGYGFAKVDKGYNVGGDVYIHWSFLANFEQLLWKGGVADGTRITCRVEMGEKGPFASEVLQFEAPNNEPPKEADVRALKVPVLVSVASFDRNRRFGFLLTEGGGKFFLHLNAIERSQIPLEEIVEGRKLKVLKTSDDGRTPEAVELELVS